MSRDRPPYYNIQRVKNRCNAIDTHEILKREIYKQGGFNDLDFKVSNSAINNQQTDVPASAPASAPASTPSTSIKVGFEDNEFLFDSVSRDSGSDLSAGEMKWSITNINNSQDIRNCVAMKVGPLYFPKLYLSTAYPEYFYYRRLYMEVTNLPSNQGVLCPNSNRYHFEFKTTSTTSQSIEFTPVKDTYVFQRPVNSLTEFDVRFSVPSTTTTNNFKRIPIPGDTVSIISVDNAGAGYNPIRFTITSGETTSVLGLTGSLGTPGVAIFITGFASNSSAVNTAVNDTDGVFATTVIDSTTFSISSINGTAVTSAATATMFILKNRISFSTRFTSAQNRDTNYVTMVQE